MKNIRIPVEKLKKGIKPVMRRMILCAAVMCVAAVILYLAGAWYYREKFTVNTWINGIYCTGKTVEEVNSEFLLLAETPSIRIVDLEGQSYELSAEGIMYTVDFTEGLQDILKAQNSWLWPVNLLCKVRQLTVSPEGTYEEALLQQFWEALPCVTEAASSEATVSIIWTENGYQLEDLTKDMLDAQAGYSCLKNALETGQSELDLVEEQLYRSVPVTEEQSKVLAQWEKVAEFQSMEIIYDMGDEQIVLKEGNIGGFLIREENGYFQEEEDGSLTISREKTDAFIDTLADEYDTYKKERTFASTRGDSITLTKGTYGTLIDRDEEKEYLYDALVNRISEVHVPAYKREAYHRGLNDIGETYIEIDMTEQKMYFYKEGECLVETDIVTGNTGRKWGTPEGVYYIYAMQRNRILRGTGYASFVNYWMPVNGNIGIHDANWRKEFGGEIYKKNGSHGCINTPYEKMKTIYEEVEIGVPVIIFY